MVRVLKTLLLGFSCEFFQKDLWRPSEKLGVALNSFFVRIFRNSVFLNLFVVSFLLDLHNGNLAGSCDLFWNSFFLFLFCGIAALYNFNTSMVMVGKRLFIKVTVELSWSYHITLECNRCYNEWPYRFSFQIVADNVYKHLRIYLQSFEKRIPIPMFALNPTFFFRCARE